MQYAIQKQQENPDKAKKTTLENKLAHKLWRSSDILKREISVIDTGYPELNNTLNGNGWPLGVTTEVGLHDLGIGELRLLIPALRTLTQKSLSNPYVVWVAPPALPFAPELEKQGIELQHLSLVRTRDIEDTLWAAEQALLSGCCAAVFTWVGQHNLTTRQSRRLQLAAEKNRVWHVMLRDHAMLQQTSVAALRMQLTTDRYSRLNIDVIKQPQGWAGQRCSLSLPPHYHNWQRLPASLLPHNNSVFSDARVKVLAKAVSKIDSVDIAYQTNNVIALQKVN